MSHRLPKKHDPLCTPYECQCAFIAKIRADERKWCAKEIYAMACISCGSMECRALYDAANTLMGIDY